jgi:hypothetical protein
VNFPVKLGEWVYLNGYKSILSKEIQEAVKLATGVDILISLDLSDMTAIKIQYKSPALATSAAASSSSSTGHTATAAYQAETNTSCIPEEYAATWTPRDKTFYLTILSHMKGMDNKPHNIKEAMISYRPKQERLDEISSALTLKNTQFDVQIKIEISEASRSEWIRKIFTPKAVGSELNAAEMQFLHKLLVKLRAFMGEIKRQPDKGQWASHEGGLIELPVGVRVDKLGVLADCVGDANEEWRVTLSQANNTADKNMLKMNFHSVDSDAVRVRGLGYHK